MKNLIFDSYNSEVGRRVIEDTLRDFQSVISIFERIYNRYPFNQQTAQSLTELFLLTKILNPKTIFELGCGTRSSTVALSSANSGATVYGLDISPVNFESLMNSNFPNINHSRVIDYSLNAAIFEIPEEWEKPIFTLYDAHDGDLPGVEIFSHAKSHWFSKLKGQIIAFHDCSVMQEEPHNLSVGHVSSRHFSGKYIVGYSEVKHLVNWMNENGLDFYRPGDDLQRMCFDGSNSSIICVEILNEKY
jgi:hypothetical protein